MQQFVSYAVGDGGYVAIIYCNGVYTTNEIQDDEIEEVRATHRIWPTSTEAMDEIKRQIEPGF